MSRARERQRCVHFNGIQNQVCQAGIRYDAVRVNGSGIPCLAHLGNGAQLSCEARRFPTEEEVEQIIKERDEAVAKSLAGLVAVMEDAEKRGFKKGNGGRGEVECPACGGVIRYSVASVNGHRMAKCTTDGCVSFIE